MTARIIATLVAAAVRRPGATAVLTLAVMGGFAAIGTRLELADDARALVANSDPEIARQLAALSEFTAVDSLLLHVDGHGDAEQLERAAHFVVDGLLQSGRFATARFDVPVVAQLELVRTLAPQRFALDPRMPSELFAAAALNNRLLELRETLLMPSAILGKDLAIRDPMGSLTAALGDLSAAPGFPGLDVSSGRFFSRDGRSLLVVAEPHGNPFGSDDAEISMAVVDALRAKLPEVAPQATLHVLGAHRYTRDAARMIKSDVHFSVATSLLGVLAIFVAFFRRPALALCAVPPIAFGASVGFAAAGLLGEAVHPIVLAFAGVCVSLSVDYTIHLVTAATAGGGDARRELPLAARRMGPSLLLVMTTTLAGLAALCLSQVPALRHMGILSMAAVLGAFVGTLLWVPVVLPHLPGAAGALPVARGPWTWAVDVSKRHPRTVVALAAVLALAGAIGAAGTRLDGDLRHLDTHTPDAVADERAVFTAFGDPGSTAMVLIEAPSLAAALESATRIAAGLPPAGSTKVLSPTTLAPAPSVVAARRAAWCAGPGEGQSWADALDAAAVTAHFAPTAFAQFRADLEAFCAAAPEASEEHAQAALHAFGGLIGRPVVRPGARGSVKLAVAFDIADAAIDKAGAVVRAEPGALLVHRASLNAAAIRVVSRDLPLLGLVSFALVILLLLGTFRSFLHAVRALAPCALALTFTLGVLAFSDTPINLMNLCVFPLLAGIGIDYGVLMADAERDAHVGALHERAFSLSVAAITAVADFGTLAIADYYALATIGRSVIIAVGSAALFALFLPPALAALARPATPAAQKRTTPA